MNTKAAVMPIILFLLTTCAIVGTHWALVRAYANFCVPSGVTGFLTSFVTVSSPMCSNLNYLQVMTASGYDNICTAAFIGLTAWIMNRVGNSSRAIHPGSLNAKRWENMCYGKSGHVGKTSVTSPLITN